MQFVVLFLAAQLAAVVRANDCKVTDGTEQNDLQGADTCKCGVEVCNSAKPYCNRHFYKNHICGESPIPDCKNQNGAIQNIMSEGGRCVCGLSICDIAHPYCDFPSGTYTWRVGRCSSGPQDCKVTDGTEQNDLQGADTCKCGLEVCNSAKPYCNRHFYEGQICSESPIPDCKNQNGAIQNIMSEGRRCVCGLSICDIAHPYCDFPPRTYILRVGRCSIGPQDCKVIDGTEQNDLQGAAKCQCGLEVCNSAKPYCNRHFYENRRCSESPIPDCKNQNGAIQNIMSEGGRCVCGMSTCDIAHPYCVFPQATFTMRVGRCSSGPQGLVVRTATQRATSTTAAPVALGSETAKNDVRFSVVAVTMLSVVVVAVVILMILFVIRFSRSKTDLGQDPGEHSRATSSV